MGTQTKKLTLPAGRQAKGFTIIEVLIVLAIAGLILAIVFLAVPALQRNSRNTGIRSDAASVLAAVNDFIANNQGVLPTGISVSGNTVTITGAAGSTSSEAKVRGGTAVSLTATMPGATGTIAIAINNKCNGNAFQASQRAVAAGFRVENTSSTTAPQCIES
ncbi:prepilin-type N-terminal cleavage/methylation domain-containing protein [Candidatus Saccharibacteria bacterium]|nr:prepilin-type N-terminal cleavage/methylation domain-containing protein [Candidatus Saccharibacteria bacterium]MBI2285800.1 prepilin-type N-terminal cleavage/methylation domain-containing protein [Candidatus Saccharibacteria bacterium]